MILASSSSIKKFTQMGAWGDKTLIDYFKSHVKKDPERVCVIDPPNKEKLVGLPAERLTYRDLDRAADAVAEALVAEGIEKDDVVLVQLPNCWELAMLYQAVSRAGALISPLPVLWRESEMSYIAGLTKARVLITIKQFNNFDHMAQAKSLQKKHPHIEKVFSLEDIRALSLGQIKQTLDSVTVDPNDIFTICWTSGTEANPKGCPLSHNNWAGMAKVQDVAGMRSGDVMLTAGPLVNMASIGTVYIPWTILGGTLLLHHPFDPQVFMKQLMEEKPNYTLLVPALANMLVKHPNVDQFDLTSFRTITLGSAPPSLYTLQEFKRRWDIEIGNIWGQNEGTGIVSGIEDIPEMDCRVDHFPQWGKPGSIWSSSASKVVEVKILDDSGEELTEVGKVGELVYKGPGVIAEYYKNPTVTQRSFTKDGFFRTGDLFQIREGDCISFFERAKDIIIRGGYNISSQEVENYLLSHPKVQEAAVVGMPDEKLGERMCAYVVPVPGQTVTFDELVCLLNEKGVARYKHPERLEYLEQIPRNPVGKILKKQLRKDLLSRMQKDLA
ncbi:2,3-dihydroxybenzoate-AMP ligase [Desulfosarcina alkanivorans]|uniref:2,3-dihydroxybenzoate-AMP ligase n=1 Tax=Desulfosarcina alkanivorans TaxID=571177 RepID=A0A5K7YMV0_9BACT|nr:class I adenylate-forming enzyme family protein [Desulfosarcina alkanivorans]BBO69753.1 2,3-dihydroxybenzoate-AMP ligase [Desulfosarcina alkanivorans]